LGNHKRVPLSGLFSEPFLKDLDLIWGINSKISSLEWKSHCPAFATYSQTTLGRLKQIGLPGSLRSFMFYALFKIASEIRI